MNVDREPCVGCPYRKDTPSGVWEADEYEKLRLYDDNQYISLFLCHHSPNKGKTACRGFLSVHSESVAVRLAVRRGDVTSDQVYSHVRTNLYMTGNEAAEAGMAEIDDPSPEAMALIDDLVQRNRKRNKRNKRRLHRDRH